MKNECAVCVYCTYEPDVNCFICHNESSQRFGDELPYSEMRKSCPDFKPHNYNMPLKEALKCGTGADFDNGAKGVYVHQCSPRSDHHIAAVTFLFDNNTALAKFMGARVALFAKYMEMAEKDGDFKKEGEKG